MSCRLTVSNLHHFTTERDLYLTMTKLGIVPVDVSVVADGMSGQSLGMAHIRFENEGAAAHAQHILHHYVLRGCKLDVQAANEPQRRPVSQERRGVVGEAGAKNGSQRPRYRDTNFRRRKEDIQAEFDEE